MGRIAFIFSGQGDQHPGMGKELVEQYSIAAQIYDMCDGLRPGTLAQCLEGSQEELQETKNTQPCLFAMELAAASVLLEQGVLPEAVAGFSLGEVAAATVAGIFDQETGFRLVCKRGEIMQQEAEKYQTSMVAVVKLTPEQVQEVCYKYSDVYPVNFNCPGQIAVSGLSSQMGDFAADIRAAGGKALPLKVKAAFHSPFMKEAADGFARELEQVLVKERTIELYSNLTAEPYSQDVRGLLSKQICNPVQWEKTINHMIDRGIDTFIEIGPGKTLTTMMKRINPGVKAQTVMDYLREAEGC